MAADETGIDINMGIGGAPEGVLAAAALRCIGGQIQTQLQATSDQHRARVAEIGIKDIDQKYTLEDLAPGDVLFAATEVASGSMLQGVRFRTGVTRTETVVRRYRNRGGWYGRLDTASDLLQWNTLLALATVCNIIPLIGFNRSLVSKGLLFIQKHQNPGLRRVSGTAGWL